MTTLSDSRLQIEPSEVSIVIQGPLNRKNLLSLATNIQHWRSILPESELILVISSTNLVMRRTGGEALVFCDPETEHDSDARHALLSVNNLCDTIALIDGATPLPPIKNDNDAANNINYQIASSTLGLKLANRPYALKTRTDLILLDNRFLKFYTENYNVRRGARQCLSQRVMIPSIFTLNPYSIERLPFHYSDWLQFGLTADIRKIWNLKPFPLQDSAHYSANPHAPHSNGAERLFLTRIAVEQYVYSSLARKYFDDITLSYLNDFTSRSSSIDFLVDNFIVCDQQDIALYLPKYSGHFKDENNREKCVSHKLWKHILANRAGDYESLLSVSGKIFYDEPDDDFPAKFSLSDLHTKNSELKSGSITNTARSGTLSYGPYIALRRGRYKFTIHTRKIIGMGTVSISINKDFGRGVLRRYSIPLFKRLSGTKFEIVFDISEAICPNVEVLIKYKNIKTISLTSLDLERIR